MKSAEVTAEYVKGFLHLQRTAVLYQIRFLSIKAATFYVTSKGWLKKKKKAFRTVFKTRYRDWCVPPLTFYGVNIQIYGVLR